MPRKISYHCLHCNRDFASYSQTPTECPLCRCKTWDTEPRQSRDKHIIMPTREGKKTPMPTARMFGGYGRSTNGYTPDKVG